MNKKDCLIKRTETTKLFMSFLEEANNKNKEENSTARIRSHIQKVISEKQNIKTIKAGAKLYRARIIKYSDLLSNKLKRINDKDVIICGFDEAGSREAPLYNTEIGRNNYKGESFLYTANSIDVACSEVKPMIGDYISLAEFETDKDINYFDFNTPTIRLEDENIDILYLFEKIEKLYKDPVKTNDDKHTYLPTILISRIIRENSVRAISYGSQFSPAGINYTFFDKEDTKNFKFQGSKIIRCQGYRIDYIDYDSCKLFSSISNIENKCFRLKNKKKELEEYIKFNIYDAECFGEYNSDYNFEEYDYNFRRERL